MNLFDFYKRESTASGVNILVMASISGISNGALLAIITLAAKTASQAGAGIQIRYFILFVISLLLFISGKRYALKQAIVVSETLIKKVRMRISNKIRQSELIFLRILINHTSIRESPRHQFYITVCPYYYQRLPICHYTGVLFDIYRLVIKTGARYYVGAIAAATLIYFIYRREVIILLIVTTEKETELFDSLSHVINGFKELKVNWRKSNDTFFHFREISDTTEEIKVKTGFSFVTDFVFSQTFFYVLIATLVFLLPALTSIYSEVVVKLVMAVLFIVAPLEMVIGAIPSFAKASVAVDNLYKLEEKIDAFGGIIPETEHIPPTPIVSFQEIRMDKATFSYLGKEDRVLFYLGPIDISIKRGEIVFLVGGNGCGKSTLLKLLTGLYYPLSGVLRLDGEVLSKPTYIPYRELFSIIFTDFHLLISYMV